MEQVGGVKRMMEEAESRGFYETVEVVCVAHLTENLAGFVTGRPNDGTACIACGDGDREVFDLDELLDVAAGCLRTYWLDANNHLYRDSESASGWACVDPVTADELVRDDILGGDVDDDLLEIVTRPDLLGDQQWFDPELLWLEGTGLITYSWASFHKWAVSQPATVDIAAISTKPSAMFGHGSDEGANGIDPNDVLSRLLRLIEDHVGLRKVPTTQQWHRALLLEPDDEPSAARLGSAPAARAAANRMSPTGVSMFYGADDDATARAEIRPRPGDRVVTGAWHPTRTLEVLDLVEPGRAPSYFDWEQATVRVGIKSLEAFAEALSAPIAAGAAAEYRSTQAFTEYLRQELPGINGIRYKSSLTGRPCCVLFADNDACNPHSGHPQMLELDGHTDSAEP